MSEKNREAFRCGYAAIAGLPNVGKSTLLNRIIAEPIAIVTPKPQTTRNRILGIHNAPGAQAIFIDTPGLCDEINELNKHLNTEIRKALADADVIVHLIDPREKRTGEERVLAGLAGSAKATAFLAANKIDTLSNRDAIHERVETLREAGRFEKVFFISAATGEGVPALVDSIIEHLPFSPPFYPEDEITTSNMRFIVAEMVREQVLLKTQREVPYSTAVVIESYKEPEEEGGLVRIEAEVFVERDSQKGILIGAGGQMLKSIGQAARLKLEAFLGQRVYLHLQVKVRKDWTHDRQALKRLGYE